MSRYPPPGGSPPSDDSHRTYVDPFQDASARGQQFTRQQGEIAHPAEQLGGYTSSGNGETGSRPRYQLSDSYATSQSNLGHASTYSFVDQEKDDYLGGEEDDEYRPLKEDYGGGFHRAEGQE